MDLSCPGGWSYEDRIRAGVIASKDPLMNKIKEQAKIRKPVIGICNGCQVLIETGMIPGISGRVEMAMAQNINPFVSGFYCIGQRSRIPERKMHSILLLWKWRDN
jgi:phosphoribosylformylglycinamidine synthase